MRAIVKYELGPGNVEVRDIPEPEVAPGLVKVKIVRAALCASDVSQYRAKIPMRLNVPVVMGHEFSGIVEEVGEGCNLGFKPGDRVVAENGFSVCGSCEYCRAGWYNVCVDRKVLGFYHNGTFAEKMLIPEKNLHRIPDGVDFDAAALTEPLASVCHACFDQMVIKANDVVIVSGPGPMGLLAVMVAKSFGALVVVTGLTQDAMRLEKAKEIGADYAVNIQEESIEELINKLTNGYGADAVIECSGAHAAVNMCLKLCRKRGYYCQFGLTGQMQKFDMETVMFREINLTGSMSCVYYDWEKALSLMASGAADTKSICSRPYSVYDWEKIIDAFESKQELKIIIDPSLPEPTV